MIPCPKPITLPPPIDAAATTSYRSPLAAARRNLFYCAGEPNLYEVGDDYFQLAFFLMYFSGWLCMESNDGSYDMKMLFPKPAAVFDILLDIGWINPPDPRDSLERASAAELSRIRAENGLPPAKGKKAQLVDSLMNDASPAFLSRYASSHWYANPTQLGYHVLRSLYNERVEIELSAARALSRGEEDVAAGLVADYWERRTIFARPSSYPDISYRLNTPVECLVAATRHYFSGTCIAREYLEFFSKHDDAVMQSEIIEMLFVQ